MTLEEVFNKLSPLIFSVSVNILKSREEAQDVVQDIFLNKIPGILSKDPDITWDELSRLLAVTTRNYSIDIYRRQKKQTPWQDFNEGSTERGQQEHAHPIDYKRAMGSLEPKYQEVLTLKYMWSLTWEEVGSRLGLSVQGARKRAARAAELFRKTLKGAPGRHD
jgi:RNA polymerase sigma factor (sigma-70 family)